jgi:MoaA/NifB/PqqE/SkfB family radical SAM enzyme
MELLESGSCPGSATFNPGSICNLACVTCGPDASTRWQKELGIPIVPGNPREISQETVYRIKQMTGIVVGGGEPVLNFSTETLLENLNSHQLVSVHFNGTVLPRQSFLDKSSRLQNIRYVFSIDGIGRRFEYLRWPAKWDQVVQNILWLFNNAPDNVEFGLNITISQLNRFYQDEIVDWINQTIPRNKNNKKTVIMYNQAGDDLLKQHYLDGLDKKRNLRWRELFPLAVESIL